MTRFAQTERRNLATLLEEVGPEAPTLCEGWRAEDLAAHIAIRERRPDAAAGIVLSSLSGHTQRVQRKLTQNRDFRDVIHLIRSGPPWWSPLRFARFDEAANTIEFYVHHEDLRRAQPTWTPRDPHSDFETEVWKHMKRLGPRLARRAPCGVHLEALGINQLVLSDVPELTPMAANEKNIHSGSPTVRVRGLPTELILFCYGRQQVARVELSGDAEAVEKLRNAPLGL